MQSKLVRFFLYSAGAVLLLTAAAKFVSSAGSSRILLEQDPIAMMSFKNLFWIVGSLELIVAAFCIFSKKTGFSAGTVAWLATCFVVYRLGLSWVGYQKPCACLGDLTDALHISATRADFIVKILLGYLVVGSYTALVSIWLRRNDRLPIVSAVG